MEMPFKNDDWLDSPNKAKERPYGPEYAYIVLENGTNCSVIDDIFESCSGKYYIWCWDSNDGAFKPIDIEKIAQVHLHSTRTNSEREFLLNNLEKFKLKAQRSNKLERILK